MCEKHSEIMVDFISENPWLYLDEVSSLLYSIAVVEVIIKRMRGYHAVLLALFFSVFAICAHSKNKRKAFMAIYSLGKAKFPAFLRA